MTGLYLSSKLLCSSGGCLINSVSPGNTNQLDTTLGYVQGLQHIQRRDDKIGRHSVITVIHVIP